MQQVNSAKTKDDTKKAPFKSRRKILLILFVVVIIVLLALLISKAASDDSPIRTESYKDVSGAAGLNASIAYDCSRDCGQKFDFSVYLFTKDGRQTNVVRPDKDGRVRLAMPEGEYVMLIGKQFGQDKEFPQEPLSLKNGKELELKLKY